jgi:hypothetical protein
VTKDPIVRIPSDYHLIFGLTTEDKPFSLTHYLTVASCHEVNHPDRINFYYRYEPSGIWWERAKPYLNLVPIQPPDEVFGNALKHPAHKADVLRLEILRERGGIYLDTDVLCVRPFACLQEFETVLGEEYGVGLCNAVILAAAGSRFLEKWYAEYTTFRAEDWNHHSVLLPKKLAGEHPGEVHVLDHRKFFWPMYWADHLEAFFLNPGSTFSQESFCVHLWESRTWKFLGPLLPADLWMVESEFAHLARPYVKPAWLDR